MFYLTPFVQCNLIIWLFRCLARKHHVPVPDFALRQAHRLWVGPKNHTGTTNASAFRHPRVHPTRDHRLRTHRPRIGHVVRGSDLLRAVSDLTAIPFRCTSTCCECVLILTIFIFHFFTALRLSGLSPFMGDNDPETFTNITKAEFDFDDEAFDAVSQDAKDFISALLIKRKEYGTPTAVVLRDNGVVMYNIVVRVWDFRILHYALIYNILPPP